MDTVKNREFSAHVLLRRELLPHMEENIVNGVMLTHGFKISLRKNSKWPGFLFPF